MNEKLRTAHQNNAMHVWFKESANECINQGVCVNDIIGKTMNLQVDEGFIKWLFRRVGKKKYGADSTAKLTSIQIDSIYDEIVKFFAEKVDPPIQLPPFPNKYENEEYGFKKAVEDF